MSREAKKLELARQSRLSERLKKLHYGETAVQMYCISCILCIILYFLLLEYTIFCTVLPLYTYTHTHTQYSVHARLVQLYSAFS